MGILDDYTKEGYWEVIGAPAHKNKNYVKLQDMHELVNSCQARHRGWPFPYTRHEDIKQLNNCLQSVTIGRTVPKHEGFRLYENGLFYWRGSMWENYSEKYEKMSFSYVSANWKITEILLFLKRLYSKILKVDDIIHLQITIMGCKDRFFSDDYEYRLPPNFDISKCDENEIILKKTVNNSILQTSWQDIAVEFIQKLCALFKVNNVSDDFTKNLQSKLLNMKMI